MSIDLRVWCQWRSQCCMSPSSNDTRSGKWCYFYHKPDQIYVPLQVAAFVDIYNCRWHILVGESSSPADIFASSSIDCNSRPLCMDLDAAMELIFRVCKTFAAAHKDFCKWLHRRRKPSSKWLYSSDFCDCWSILGTWCIVEARWDLQCNSCRWNIL